MRITNVNNLPQPFVDAVTSDYTYTDKRYSVTTLLKSIREIMLTRRHNDEIEQDVTDMIWALFGTAIHSVLENANNEKRLLKEQKLEVKFGDYTLSGRTDLYDTETKTLIDYKVTSTYKVLNRDYEDYKMQGLMYAYMLKKLGYQVVKTQFVLVLRDWQSSKAKIDKTYPQMQVVIVTFNFTEKDYTYIEKWLTDKFAEIANAEQLTDSELPECTAEERWNSGDTYAVMKDGRKTALRVLNSREDAETYKANNGGDYIEERHGEDRKCAEYCPCCQFCEYYKNKVENGGTNKMPF